MRRLTLLLLLGAVLVSRATPAETRTPAAAPTPGFQWNLPPGFPTPKVPSDNPITKEKVALGRFLFYDTRLSGNQTFACATCHQQENAFTDGRPQAVGSTGQVHPRNSMSLTNAAYGPRLGWANPTLVDLESQALVPMFGEQPVELGLAGRETELFDRLASNARYQRLFSDAFPDDSTPVNLANITRSIASFVRTLLSGNTPYDRYVLGLDDHALSASAIRGGALFFSERLECFHCHGGFNFTSSVSFQGQAFDEITFENNGLYNIDGQGGYPVPNRGLYEFTQMAADMGRFKPPTLRNIELTAPYMHDGSIATLEDMLDHYGAGGRTIHDGPNAGDGSKNPYKSIFIRGFTLTDQERTDVLNLLKSFTDRDFVTNPRFSDPFAARTCGSDCDYDGQVSVDELITSVNIGLGVAPLADCVGADTDTDGAVDVSEIISAVNAALQGCS